MINREIKVFGRLMRLTMRNDGDFAIANELFLDHQYRFCDETIKKAVKYCPVSDSSITSLNPTVVIVIIVIYIALVNVASSIII